MMPSIYPKSKLPELPTSRPSTSSASQLKMPYVNTADAMETNQVLQKHFLSVQETLMSVVDKKVETYRTKVIEQGNQLKRTEKEKEALGVELYTTKLNVGRLNSTLAKMYFIITNSNDNLEQKEIAAKLAISEATLIERQNAELVKVNKELAQNDLNLKVKISEADMKAEQLQEISASFSADLKIQSRINSKIRKDLEISESKRKDAEANYDDEKRKSEKLTREKCELETQLQNQKMETFRMQGAIDRLNNEVNLLRDTNKTIKKKWEDSLASMEKRDETLGAVEKSQSLYKDKFTKTDLELKACMAQLNESQKNLREKESGIKFLI